MAEKFKGFSIPSGFTQTPNEFYDLIMQNKLSLIEIRLLSFMIRMTFGWRKDGYCLQFSLNDMVKYLGFTKKTARQAIDSCLEKGYIEHNVIHGMNYYRLVLDESTAVEWSYEFDWRKAISDELLEIHKKKKNNGDPKDNPDDPEDTLSDQKEYPSDLKDHPGHVKDDTGDQKDDRSVIFQTTFGSQKDNLSVVEKITGDGEKNQSGQGVVATLNKSINISTKENINIDSDEEEDNDYDESTIMCKNFFISEVVDKLKLPQAFYDKVLNEIDWSSITPIVAQRASIKFRKAFMLGQITSNPFVWFKRTLENEEIIYLNEFYNMKDW